MEVIPLQEANTAAAGALALASMDDPVNRYVLSDLKRCENLLQYALRGGSGAPRTGTRPERLRSSLAVFCGACRRTRKPRQPMR